MPSITVQCSHCRSRLKLKDRGKLGKKVACPRCGKPFVVQAPDPENAINMSLNEFGDDYAPTPPRRAPKTARSSSGRNRTKKSSGLSAGRKLLIGLGVTAVLGLALVVGVGFWIYNAVSAGVDELEQIARETDFEQLVDESVSEIERAQQEQIRNTISQQAPQGFASPQDAFNSMKGEIASRDWQAMAACMTDESQEMMAGGLLLMGGLASAFGGDEAPGIAAVMERHGIDPNEGPTIGDDGEFNLPVRNKPAFIGDMLNAMQSIDGAMDEGPVSWAETSTLSELNVNGNAATATVVTATSVGEQREPIEFRRAGNSWLVHLPDEAMQLSGGPPQSRRPTVESAPADDPQLPIPEQTLENGLTARLAVYRERPFEFLSLGHDFPDNALFATIELVGPQIPVCYEYGHFRVTTARDDQSRVLQVIGGMRTDFGEEFANDFIELDSFFLDKADTLPLRFVLEPESGAAGSIAQLEATVKLKVRPVVIVEDILGRVGRELTDGKLASIGTFKVVRPAADEARPGQGVVIEYTGPDDRIDEIVLLDGDGEEIFANRFSFGFGRQRRFIIDAGENLPQDTQLRMTLQGNDDVLELPLKFEDVPIFREADFF